MSGSRRSASDAVAIEASHQDVVRDQAITVVGLAALGEAPDPPPGLPRFPHPGEVWLSPALAELARQLPDDELAARFPRQVGVLGDEALVYPGELVAVVGHQPDAPELTAPRGGDSIVATAPVKVATLDGQASQDAKHYQMLAVIASVLMVVPLLVFGGAAARLTVARRDQRLAALRLVGATPGQVVGMTVAEAVIVALAGALAGTVVFVLAVPLLAGIPMQGGPWFVADVFPNPLVMAAVLVAVPLLVKPAQNVVVAALDGAVGTATVDRARTALAGLVPGRTPATRADDDQTARQFLADIRVGTNVVLAVSFLVAIASSGITAMSSVLDRRQTYGLLRLAGTPLEVLDRARRAETLIPLTVMGGGSILVGVLCALPFMSGVTSGGAGTVGAATLGGCVVAGFAGVIGAGALSRPLLRAVTADTAPRPD
ncbi:hypothetical protein GCM10009555_035510 [Acrocarpospora macrocephala]|uniref:ABC3 transporter permease C-terminal domain-containing protein n=1 Tax=Acrocarpospora macrocephala TaxID=150177 RepID=A0A5M3X6F6_9ACTN|nr:ABC transporter permease [Acrocarpospora macrocephala]GES16654.1 hypothetical protein Amac_102520 [Acrocarpospora macrocephala]